MIFIHFHTEHLITLKIYRYKNEINDLFYDKYKILYNSVSYDQDEMDSLLSDLNVDINYVILCL